MSPILEKLLLGEKFMKNKEYSTAERIFNEIISCGESECLSGAYTNIGWIKLHRNKVQQAKDFLDIALQIKPNNMSAKSLYILCYTLENNIVEALKLVIELRLDYGKYILDNGIEEEAQSDIMECAFMVQSIKSIAMMFHKIQQDNLYFKLKDNEEVLLDFYNNYKYDIPDFMSVIGEYFMAINSYQRAYSIYKELLEIKNDNEEFMIKTSINMCWISVVNNDCKEAIRIGEQIKNKNMKLDLKIALFNNLGTAYERNNEIDKCIDLLTNHVKLYKNSTDLFTLSKALYRKGELDKALVLCNQSLFLQEDEEVLRLKGMILNSLGDNEGAIKYIKKAIAFLETHKEFMSNEKEPVQYKSINFNITGSLLDLYIELLKAYINGQKYEMAQSIVQYIEKKWPYTMQLDLYRQLIKVGMEQETILMDLNDKSIELEATIEETKKLYKEKEYLNKKWASRLMALQVIDIDNKGNELDNIEDIIVNIEKIVQEMLEDKKNKSMLSEIRKEVILNYPGLSKQAVDFIVTGEYLYRVNKNKEIDFAPIMVEYCKVIEVELNIYLRRNKLISNNDNKTLGQIKHIMILGDNNEKFNAFLSEVIQFRNGSAHSGASTQEKVERVRELLFGKLNWLEQIIDMKKEECY